jgi:hypothetical protein
MTIEGVNSADLIVISFLANYKEQKSLNNPNLSIIKRGI